jgi:hypothetical protein
LEYHAICSFARDARRCDTGWCRIASQPSLRLAEPDRKIVGDEECADANRVGNQFALGDDLTVFCRGLFGPLEFVAFKETAFTSLRFFVAAFPIVDSLASVQAQEKYRVYLSTCTGEPTARSATDSRFSSTRENERTGIQATSRRLGLQARPAQHG